MNSKTKIEGDNVKYKSFRIIDGKPRNVIIELADIDAETKIVNYNPSKDDLKGLKEAPYIVRYKSSITTNEKLLEHLKRFYKENGRTPKVRDFTNNPEYPGATIYYTRFGNWNKALKLVGLDVDSMVKRGVLQDSNHKGRLFEIIVSNSFDSISADLSKDNHGSPCDGICPRGKIYDAKSSKLYRDRGEYYNFNIKNKYKEEIEYYYFGAFNEDFKKLEHVWRVPGEIVEKDHFVIGLNGNWDYNLENMKEYEITDKFKDKFKDMFGAL